MSGGMKVTSKLAVCPWAMTCARNTHDKLAHLTCKLIFEITLVQDNKIILINVLDKL